MLKAYPDGPRMRNDAGFLPHQVDIDSPQLKKYVAWRALFCVCELHPLSDMHIVCVVPGIFLYLCSRGMGHGVG